MKKWVFWTTVVVSACFVFLTWGGVFFVVFSKLHENTIQNFGVFGDSFGALSSLYTGLALVGAFAALLYQKLDIESSAEAERKSSKIAALAAALDAKANLCDQLDKSIDQLRQNTAARAQTDQERQQAEMFLGVKQRLLNEMLNINHDLDTLVKSLGATSEP